LKRDEQSAILERQRLKETAEREASAKERDYKKPYFERQLATYFEASAVAATIATLPAGEANRTKAETRFRQLYHGDLVLVEEKDVMEAKAAFNNCLEELDEMCGSEPNKTFRLRRLSLNLAMRCRASIASAWTIDLKDLKDFYLQDTTPRRLP
jgi:hypothetical protein